MCDDISAAALRIGVNGLTIAEDQNQQQTDNRSHNGQKVSVGQHAEYRDQNQENLLTGITYGGNGIAGEDRNTP